MATTREPNTDSRMCYIPYVDLNQKKSQRTSALQLVFLWNTSSLVFYIASMSGKNFWASKAILRSWFYSQLDWAKETSFWLFLAFSNVHGILGNRNSPGQAAGCGWICLIFPNLGFLFWYKGLKNQLKRFLKKDSS